jgi:hypothetical protein
VVDVFYVTERGGSKPVSKERQDQIRARMLEVVGGAAVGK